MLRLFKLYKSFSIQPHLRSIKGFGIQSSKVVFNPCVPQIYQDTFLKIQPSDPFTKKSFVSSNGALCAYSGINTERQNQNSRIVKDSAIQKLIQWDSDNLDINSSTYELIERLAIDYINHGSKLYLVDGYLGWDPKYSLKVRSFCTRPYHALFLKNMLVQPTKQQLQQDFTTGIDITLFNGGQLHLSPKIAGTQNDMISAINLSQQKITILGTQFAGQMKKAFFKLASFILPRKGVLPLRASALTTNDDNVSLLVGLPGSGKGSLAIHAKKKNLIATDEIGWSAQGIYNLEGGVYARILNLKNRLQDEVYKAIRFGAVVQNANPAQTNRQINFYDVSVTQNARLCYPLRHLNSFKSPPTSKHPNNLILLTCDLEGVLPPVAKLNKQQALYLYLNGYTAKLNKKQIEPRNEFSTCFNGDSVTHHPQVYAELFNKRLEESKANVWLVNTGWTFGRLGIGRRISGTDSSTIIEAINNGSLEKSERYKFPHFNFQVPEKIDGIEEKIMHPGQGWAFKQDYEQSLKNLVKKFNENYKKKFEGKIKMDLKNGMPHL